MAININSGSINIPDSKIIISEAATAFTAPSGGPVQPFQPKVGYVVDGSGFLYVGDFSYDASVEPLGTWHVGNTYTSITINFNLPEGLSFGGIIWRVYDTNNAVIGSDSTISGTVAIGTYQVTIPLTFAGVDLSFVRSTTDDGTADVRINTITLA